MTAPAPLQFTFCAQTDIGKVRKGNEDNFLVLDLAAQNSWTGSAQEILPLQTLTSDAAGVVFAVSDGMGGALAGEVASHMAVDISRALLPQLHALPQYAGLSCAEKLRVTIEEANTIIHQESQTNPACAGMGATFTAVAINEAGAFFAQVGDSRAHLIRRGNIVRITKDQSVVQQLVDLGEISESEAETHPRRNYILQALGATSEIDVVVNTVALQSDDILLLCSDGLSGKVQAQEMAEIVAAVADLSTACQQLIDLANERGGEDNITVILVQITGALLAAPDDTPVVPDIIERSLDTPSLRLLEDVGLSPPTTSDLLMEHDTLPADSSFVAAASPELSPPVKIIMENSLQRPAISGKPLILIFFAVVLMMSAGVVYLNKSQLQNRAALQARLQNEQRELLAKLRGKLQLLQQHPNNSAEITKQLAILSQRLDEAGNLDSTKYQQVGQACSEVENALILLERSGQFN